MEGERNTVVIDIEKLQSLLVNNSDHHCISLCTHDQAVSTTQSTICKVQQLIRDVHKNDYEPVVVSIGPYHHGKEHLQGMEKVKWECLEFVLKANPEKRIRDYIQALWELYPVARSCYTENIKLESNKFVHMLLLDGCFVIASICGAEWSSNNPNSALHQDLDKTMDPLEHNFVMHDFVLIENQIPFFIIRRIYELFRSNERTCLSLSDKMVLFFEEILQETPKPFKESQRPKEFDHLLHLCHMYFASSLSGSCHALQPDCGTPQLNQWHRSVEYHVAGIKFKKRDSDINNPHSLLNVSFSCDVLQIPYIFIDEITATIFRNLIALEQTKPQLGNNISAYINFISQFVSTSEDVSLLVSKGIIGHHFEREEEVSNIFRSLGECVVFDFSDNFYLKNVYQNLEALYRSHMKWDVRWLRRAKSAIQVYL